MESKTFRFSVRIEGCKTVFDPELGPGVVAMEEVTFTPKEHRSFSNAVGLAKILEERKRQLLEETIKVDIEPVE